MLFRVGIDGSGALSFNSHDFQPDCYSGSESLCLLIINSHFFPPLLSPLLQLFATWKHKKNGWRKIHKSQKSNTPSIKVSIYYFGVLLV
jgi:hypothetical protein